MNSVPKQSTSLTKLATILAVVFCIAFGLCEVSVLSSIRASEESANTYMGLPIYLARAAVAIEVICVVGLLAIAIIATTQAIRSKKRNEDSK